MHTFAQDRDADVGAEAAYIPPHRNGPTVARRSMARNMARGWFWWGYLSGLFGAFALVLVCYAIGRAAAWLF